MSASQGTIVPKDNMGTGQDATLAGGVGGQATTPSLNS
jgi:hypothetical protein